MGHITAIVAGLQFVQGLVAGEFFKDTCDILTKVGKTYPGFEQE
jgi:hypothetical protein